MSNREIIKVSEEDILRQQIFINNLREYNEDFYKVNNRWMTYFIQTYGCQMNEHDSETISGMFELMKMRVFDTFNPQKSPKSLQGLSFFVKFTK